MKEKVLIIGGGIAGPALALFLAKAGIAATVFEAYPERAEIGGALGLAPNGMAVLAELGLAGEVAAAGTICSAFAFRTPAGKPLGTAPYGGRGRYGQPAVTLARAALHEIVADAAERNGIAIRYGKRLRDIAVDADGVTARFDDGSTAQRRLRGRRRRHQLARPRDHAARRADARVHRTGRPGGFVPRSVIPIGSREDEADDGPPFRPGRLLRLRHRRRLRRHGGLLVDGARARPAADRRGTPGVHARPGAERAVRPTVRRGTRRSPASSTRPRPTSRRSTSSTSRPCRAGRRIASSSSATPPTR